MSRHRRLVPLLLLAGGLVLSAGCQGRKKEGDFTPAPEKARQALEAGVSHLQNGNGPRLAVPALAAAALLAALAWCSPKAHRAEDFVPPEETARAALDAYLRAWSRGDTAQRVPDTDPAVMGADTLRSQGRTLSAY